MVDCNVLIISQRQRPDGLGRKPGCTPWIEAENILASCTDADFAMIERNPNHPMIRSRRLASRSLQRVAGRPDTGFGVPGASYLASKTNLRFTSALDRRPRPPKRHYDLAVFIGFTLWDLPLLKHFMQGRNLADVTIAWFLEAWSSEFTGGRVDYEPFGTADVLFVGMEAAAGELRGVAERPVEFVPPAVDVRAFGAIPPDGPRPIDVLNVGRRDPNLHQALLDWSRKAAKLYVYDTLSGLQVPDAAAHRANLGDTYRRTNVAITSYAKYDLPQIVGHEREIPGRFWEGLASGVTMIGRPPDEGLQRRVLGEPMVIDLPNDPGAAVELIDQLARTPDTATRRRHVQLALRNHDWAHRWAQIFAAIGLELPTGIQSRIDNLSAMADELDADPAGHALPVTDR